MLQKLIRSKALDAARLQGCFVVGLDATGHLSFTQKHCEHCLVYRHATHTTYHHQLLEAKLLGPANMVLSMATEFIDNSDDNAALSAEERKQDCELKALSRLVPNLRAVSATAAVRLGRCGLRLRSHFATGQGP